MVAKPSAVLQARTRLANRISAVASGAAPSTSQQQAKAPFTLPVVFISTEVRAYFNRPL
jgi:hypothetical protein